MCSQAVVDDVERFASNYWVTTTTQSWQGSNMEFGTIQNNLAPRLQDPVGTFPYLSILCFDVADLLAPLDAGEQGQVASGCITCRSVVDQLSLEVRWMF